MIGLEKICGYCGSTNIVIDSSGIYNYKGKDYNFEIYVCDEEDNGCNHSWTIYSLNLPKEGLEKLYKELAKDFNTN